jgi:hypothetical protein
LLGGLETSQTVLVLVHLDLVLGLLVDLTSVVEGNVEGCLVHSVAVANAGVVRKVRRYAEGGGKRHCHYLRLWVQVDVKNNAEGTVSSAISGALLRKFTIRNSVGMHAAVEEL